LPRCEVLQYNIRMSDVSAASQDKIAPAAASPAPTSALRLSAAERLAFVSLVVAALWGGVYWALR